MVRFRYSKQLVPPAPFAQVTLIRPGADSRLVELFPAQLDTAADCTVIPQDLVSQLDLQPTGSKLVQGFAGVIQQRTTFGVSLQFRGHEQRVLLNCIADDAEPYVLIGRDMLNRFRIQFDGPDGVVQID
jgi:hypothetical protein